MDLFSWTEEQFLERTAGSAIRRTGYEGWLRTIAIALGNVDLSRSDDPEGILRSLQSRSEHASNLVREHVQWALDRLAPGF